MEKLQFKTNNINFTQNANSPATSQENFTALDKEKIKQDTVELTNQAKEQVKENWVFRVMRNTFGVEDPKKTLTSLALTLSTVVGLAVLGNKSAHKMTELGFKVDEKLANSKIYKSISSFFTNAGKKASNLFKKSKTGQDISETLKTRKAKPKSDMTRGYGRGFVSIFSLTPKDVLDKSFKGKSADEIKNVLKNILDDVDADSISKKIAGENPIKDNREFCEELSNAIRKHFNCKNDNKAFYNVLRRLENGEFGADFTNVKMKEKGAGALVGSWWPVNIIESIGKVFKKDFKFGRGNLGNSLIKFNVVNNSLADTKIGSLAQKSILIPTESISNFVNDKSGMGALLCASIMSLYNNVQDAPKEKRLATVADDYVGTMGSIAISTPLAFATTYGLASLKNLEGKSFISKYVLKPLGKIFGVGLDSIAKDGTITAGSKNFFKRFGGGALRFTLIMFVFSNWFSKPIRGAIHKIFGKPYNATEEQQKAQLEAQKKQIIPELGITQEEFAKKIEQNPQVLEKIQNNDELAQKIAQNPKLLLDLLDGKDISNSPSTNNNVASKPKQNQGLSPANMSLIGKTNNKQELFSPKKEEQTQTTTQQQVQDTATYIPSSTFVAKTNTISAEQSQEVEMALANADKALKRAEKFI